MEKKVKSAKKVSNKKVTAKNTKAIMETSANSIIAEIKEGSEAINGLVKKGLTQIVDKVELTEGFDKIKDAVQIINNEVMETATEIVAEVKETSADVSKIATKKVKNLSKKVNAELTETVGTVKAKANKMEKQLNENAVIMKKNTVKLANEVVENLKINDRMTTIKTAVLNANKTALSTTLGLIEDLEANSTEWQKVGQKAINTGLKIASSNTEMMFATLEAVKTQIAKTTVRFQKLVKN